MGLRGSKSVNPPEGSGNQVKPMLTTSESNFKKVTHPETILSTTDQPKVTRVDLDVPNSQCFLLHGLLTQSECSHYITATESVGYSDLADQFPNDYRSNDRVLSICEPLVDELWRRIEPTLSRLEVIRVRPIGFGNEGTWKPFRLNECCKFGRYGPSGHFSPHIDGPWVPREDESSIFTVVIYLNSEFEGGSTKFLNETNPDSVFCSVVPQTGTALIFNHDTLHEGEPVSSGTKYIIRTEIMYRRVDTEMIPNPGAYQSQGNYIKTLTLYQKSWELEKVGDIKGFTDTYLEAIQLQRQAQRSISCDSSAIFDFVFPFEVYLKIFSYLTTKELCHAMSVCKAWYEICMDGQLWYNLYRRNWPVGFKLETRIDPIKPTLKFVDEKPFMRDWYGHYKRRVKLRRPQKVVVLDLGSFSFKCAAVHRRLSTVRTASTESVVAMVRGVSDLHMRRLTYQRYFCGREAKDKYPGRTRDIVVGGLVVEPGFIPEIITGLYLDCRVRPKYAPVIILEPPGLWNKQMKHDIGYWFTERFRNPCISFLSSAVANLCSLDLSSGVVVDVGHGVVTCAAVWNGEQRGYTSCEPSDATPKKLADMIEAVINDSCENTDQRSTLKELVVLTGGKACGTGLLQQELVKKDRTYTVRATADPIYSAVLGGCNLGNLSGFEQINNSELLFTADKSSYPDVKYNIYNTDVRWFSGLNNTNERRVFGRLQSHALQSEWTKDVEMEGLYDSD